MKPNPSNYLIFLGGSLVGWIAHTIPLQFNIFVKISPDVISQSVIDSSFKSGNDTNQSETNR